MPDIARFFKRKHNKYGTGLIPSLPQSEAELESYEELYPYITYPVKDEDTHVK